MFEFFISVCGGDDQSDFNPIEFTTGVFSAAGFYSVVSPTSAATAKPGATGKRTERGGGTIEEIKQSIPKKSAKKNTPGVLFPPG